MVWITNSAGDLVNLDLVKCIEIGASHAYVICHYVDEFRHEAERAEGYDFCVLFMGEKVGDATEYMEYLRQKLT